MQQLVKWGLFAALALLFLCTPYLRGLFFDTDFYLTEVSLILLFLITALWMIRKNQQYEHLIYLIVFFIPLTHVLSLLGAETPMGALDNLFRWLTYAILFIMLIWLRQIDHNDKVEKLLPIVFNATGVWISFFSLAGFWNWIVFKDIVLSGRLAGPLQYPNTFATIICAFWLYALVYLAKKEIKVFTTLFFSLPLVAYGVCFFLSYSRGAMVVFPVAWFIGVLLLKGKEQIQYLAFTVFSLVASLLVFQKMTAAGSENVDDAGLLAFVAASIIVMVLVLLTQRIVNNSSFMKETKKPLIRFVLPGFILLVGLLTLLDFKNQGLLYQAMPESLQQRITDINLGTSSVLGRTNMYMDAFAVSKEAPVFGFGGEGWRVVYPAHQELPYYSNEVHNGYLEILLNTGWLGLIVFIGVICFLVVKILIRIKKEQEEDSDSTIAVASLVSLSIILMHAFIDFDFSFGTVWFIVFWLIAIAVPLQSKDMKPSFQYSRFLIALIAVCVGIVGVYSGRILFAQSTISALTSEVDVEAAQPILEKAVKLNPYHTEYAMNLAKLYATKYTQSQQSEWKSKAEATLNSTEQLEPKGSEVLYKIGNVYLFMNDWVKADQYFQKAWEQDHFNVHFYDASIQVNAQVAFQLAKQNQKDQATVLAGKALDKYKDYVNRIEPFKAEAIPDKRPLDLNAYTYFYLGQANIILGNYADSLEQLKLVTDPSITLEVQALMIIAYEKLGQNSVAIELTQKLQAQSPSYKQLLDDYRAMLIK